MQPAASSFLLPILLLHPLRQKTMSFGTHVYPVGPRQSLVATIDIEHLEDSDPLAGAVSFLQLIRTHPQIEALFQTPRSLLIPLFRKFVTFLASQDPNLQLVSAEVFASIASQAVPQVIQLIVDAHVVPALVALLVDGDPESLLRVAVNALENIAKFKFSNYILQVGALPPLLTLALNSDLCTLTRHAAWALRTICHYYSPSRLDLNTILSEIPALVRLIDSVDEEVRKSACWAISYLLDISEEAYSGDIIQAVINAGACGLFVDLLDSPPSGDVHVHIPILRCIVNVCGGDDLQTQMVVECGCIPALHRLMCSPHEIIQTYACKAISNITASSAQIYAVIEAGIIPHLVTLATRRGPSQCEATWAICNALARSLDLHQMQHLVTFGCICAVRQALMGTSAEIARISLQTFSEIKIRWDGHLGATPQSWLPEQKTLERLLAHDDQDLACIALGMLL
ncbi:armadillo-type protein [Mycena sp. CBHHK59/15]|nr:armadillo-type protein [Mycena sp. CBHHK59/15]